MFQSKIFLNRKKYVEFLRIYLTCITENEDRSNPNESRRALTANRPQYVRDNVSKIYKIQTQIMLDRLLKHKSSENPIFLTVSCTLCLLFMPTGTW